MRSFKTKSLFFVAGILSISMFGLFLLPLSFQGMGNAALACCYDPPAATITPDAPSAASESSAPDSDTPTLTNETSTDTDEAAEADDETPPPPTLAEMLLQPARRAIASGEWLKAQIIVDEAQGRLGAEPELQRLKAKINTHFGLAAPQASPLAAPMRFMVEKLQALAASRDPLKAALSELGAGRALP